MTDSDSPNKDESVTSLAFRGVNLLAKEISRLEEISEEGSLTVSEVRLLNECLSVLGRISKDLDLRSQSFQKELATLNADELIPLLQEYARGVGLEFEIKGLKNDADTN